MIDKAELAKWLLTRPIAVQELAKELPYGCALEKDGKVLYVFGWGEAGHTVLATPFPVTFDNYHKAEANAVRICAHCAKAAKVVTS